MRQSAKNWINNVRLKVQHNNHVIPTRILQTHFQIITTSEQVARLSGTQLTAMKANNIISFIIEEAQYCAINDNFKKNAESALAAHMKKTRKFKGKKKEKSGEACGNCKKTNHTTKNCYEQGTLSLLHPFFLTDSMRLASCYTSFPILYFLSHEAYVIYHFYLSFVLLF